MTCLLLTINYSGQNEVLLLVEGGQHSSLQLDDILLFHAEDLMDLGNINPALNTYVYLHHILKRSKEIIEQNI